jgi:hypothetical protein
MARVTLLDDVHKLRLAQEKLLETQVRMLDELIGIRKGTERLADALEKLVDVVTPEVVGIRVDPGKSTPRIMETSHMSQRFKCTLTKKSAMKKSAMAPHAAGPVIDFQLVDNEDSTCTVLGVDSVGNTVDISAVATLTPPPSSSDPAILTVDLPNGMTFAVHAVGPLSTPGTPVTVTVTATWNDGSKGPFTFDLPVDVVAGGATGIMVVPGTPTPH